MADKIEVQGTAIAIMTRGQEAYISLSDMARYRDPDRADYVIQNRLRTETRLSFWGFGSNSITPLSNPSNSMDLDLAPG